MPRLLTFAPFRPARLPIRRSQNPHSPLCPRGRLAADHRTGYVLVPGKLGAALLTLLLLLLPLHSLAGQESVTRTVANGITLTQEITTGPAPLVVNVLRVDLKAPGVKIRCGQAQDAITLNGPTKGREPLHSLATRNGAVAAVNADFFPYTGDPLGLAIRDGELLSEPLEYRACFGLCPSGVLMDVLAPVGELSSADGQTSGLSGINRVPHDGEVVVLTPTYSASPRLEKPATIVTLNEVNLPVRVSQEIQGTVAGVYSLAANQPLPICSPGTVQLVAVGSEADAFQKRFKAGDKPRFRFDLTTAGLPPMRGRFPSRARSLRGMVYKTCWTDVQQAVGGGPWLVRDGQIAIDAEAEDFPLKEFVEKRHPRTALGVTAEGILLLVTVDGRQTFSQGATLAEMAALLKRYGAVNAMNLDGGGSTTLFAGGGVINSPSDGRERPIADSLLIYGDTPALPDAETLQVRPNAAEGVTLHAGESIPFALVDADGKPTDPGNSVLWGTQDGLGFLTQKGVFTAYRSGTGSVMARLGARQIVVPVRVLPGPPALLKATLGAAEFNTPDRNLLKVTLQDRYGNPIAGQNISVTLNAGQLEFPLTTDAKGEASSEILWESEPGRRVLTVAFGSLTPVTLRK